MSGIIIYLSISIFLPKAYGNQSTGLFHAGFSKLLTNLEREALEDGLLEEAVKGVLVMEDTEEGLVTEEIAVEPVEDTFVVISGQKLEDELIVGVLEEEPKNVEAENSEDELVKGGVKAEFDAKAYEEMLEGFAREFQTKVSIEHYNGTVIFEVGEYPSTASFASTAIGVSLGANYVLCTTVNESSVNQVQKILVEILPIVLSGILLVSMIGAYFCSRYIVKPIVGVSKIAQKLSALDFTLRCDVQRNDEIGLLSESLNSLADNLENTLEEVQNKNVRLEEQIRKDKLREEERNYLFTAISHELKTPLTLLSCNLDGMIYNIGKYSDRDKYLGASKKVVGSIDGLVREILTITKLESIDFSLQVEEINIGALISSVCMIYQPLAEEKQISYTFHISDGIWRKINPSLMKKVISNIIGNAVSYSPKEGKIAILLLANGVLQVENTGVIIDEKDLEEIFKPFYRVEKSRNRNTGGSGLGLYIVDRILSIHKIKYQMISKDERTCFLITF